MQNKINESNIPNICIVGAGFSGICAAIQLKKKLGIHSFTVFDYNSDLAGTWHVNTYPGCACDIQSHLYSFSFEPNPNWSQNYSSHDEIWAYLKKVAEKYALYSNIRFNTKVESLEWDDVIHKWKVTVINTNGEDQTPQNLIFDIVINGPGALRVPSYPTEFMSFKGSIIHSAEWNSNVVLENKVIAVIGSGASAVQIIPSIAKKVKELHVYQRKPAWVIPRSQFYFPDIVKFLFAFVPFLMLMYRYFIYITWEILYPVFKTNSVFNKLGVVAASVYLKQQVENDKQLIKDLTPNYAFGCKRIGISDVYLKTFTRPNVKLHRTKIDRVTEGSIVTEDGTNVKIDVLILATGFRTQDFFSPVQLFGINKENILQNWKKTAPSAYNGIMTNSAPNFFILLGPNTILGNNSVVFIVECQVNYVIKVIQKMLETGSRCVTVDRSAEMEYMNGLKKNMKPTIWASDGCGSWYTDSRGNVTALWPLPSCTYWWKTRNVDFSKLQFTN